MEDIKTKLIEFRSKYSGLSTAEVRNLLKEDPNFKAEIEELYEEVFHLKLQKTCSNCWEDAFIMLMTKKVEQMVELSERKFELKAGAVLYDLPSGDNSKMVSRHNLTDELAVYHLRKDPSRIKFFSAYPENWQEIIKETSETTSAGSSDGAGTNTQPTTREAAEKAVFNAERYVKSCKTQLDNALALEEGDEKTSAVEKATEKLNNAQKKLDIALELLESVSESESTSEGDSGSTEADSGETE